MSDSETSNENAKHLEGQISFLEQQIHDLRKQFSKAELDQWRGRIDDLEMQLHLASLEARDRISPLIEELRNSWLGAREALSESSSNITEVGETLGHGFEQARNEIRNALSEARSTLKD